MIRSADGSSVLKRQFVRGLVIMSALALALSACNGALLPGSSGANAPTRTPANAMTQRAGAAGVSIEITPLNLHDPEPSTLDFQVALDSNLADLAVDLAKLAVLRF